MPYNKRVKKGSSMNQFAKMSTQQFCNYVASNPGGAMKAYSLRVKDNPDCEEPKVVEVENKVMVEKEVIEYRDRVVYKERDRINVQYVEKEVIKYQDRVVYITPIDWMMDIADKVGVFMNKVLPSPNFYQGVIQ